MAIEDLWYKNAILYCLPVEKYMDSNDDGVGDFEGLSRRLPYLAGLGVTCLWLQPFFRSPNRDNGYDVSDWDFLKPQPLARTVVGGVAPATAGVTPTNPPSAV